MKRLHALGFALLNLGAATLLLVGVVCIIILLVANCHPAHADTYFALSQTRQWQSPDERVPEHCVTEVTKEGSDYREEYADGKLWTINDVQLGDRIYVQIKCLFDDGASWTGYSGFHEDSPWIASPAEDPNRDGCWGILDLIYWRREGQWVMDNIMWARRLWGRCLSERGRWE